MVDAPSREQMETSHQRARDAAQHYRLPFRNAVRHGFSGNWLGAGSGSSIDFHDHREYVPGDDPRYIDWRAYARTGQYTMKLYREEITPKVDIVLDCSKSMFCDRSKSNRMLELFYFAVESALSACASLRCYQTVGKMIRPFLQEAALNHQLEVLVEVSEQRCLPSLTAVKLQTGSIRILISDLLFPGAPAPFLSVLGRSKSQGIILAPFTEDESAPTWSGNMHFVDSEDQSTRKQLVDEEILKRYCEIYEQHFSVWQDECLKHRVRLARIDSGDDLLEGLEQSALKEGAVELWNS